MSGNSTFFPNFDGVKYPGVSRASCSLYFPPPKTFCYTPINTYAFVMTQLFATEIPTAFKSQRVPFSNFSVRYNFSRFNPPPPTHTRTFLLNALFATEIPSALMALLLVPLFFSVLREKISRQTYNKE